MIRIYRTIGNVELRIYGYLPQTHQTDDRRAAIVFLHGGGWIQGSPQQFKPHAEYLSSCGIAAFSAEYRLIDKHGTTPFESMEDARFAVRWVREHALELGIDPQRICVSGASAGGHLAACCAIFRDAAEKPETGESPTPNLLVLFNPALDTTDLPDFIKTRFAGRELEASPYHHMSESMPPTIIFHGAQDELVSIESIRRYDRKMRETGNDCELVVFEGMGHGFFNHDRQMENGMYRKTLILTEQFLGKHAYVNAQRGEREE